MVWMGLSVVAFVVSTIFSVINKGSIEGKTNEEIWEYMEPAMGKYKAELSPTATPASEFSYEKGYRGNAFANCTLLEEVVFSKNTSIIMGGAFYNCTSLKNVSLTSDKSSLCGIQGNSFEGCTALETVTIVSDIFPNVDIGNNAFLGCSSLKEVNISGERLEKVNFGADVFKGASSLAKISFADKISTMGKGAFANCISLTEIYLPNVEIISEAAFENCTGLTSFTVSSNTKGISEYAFRGCVTLSDITIEPATLEPDQAGYQILDRAFENTAIKEIEIPGSYNFIRSYVFAGCGQLEKIVWHNSGKNAPNQSLYYDAFVDANNLKEIYLPRTMNEIRENAIPGFCTVYAMEGSLGHTYALQNNLNWQPWTE
jgi:hypothetical protein